MAKDPYDNYIEGGSWRCNKSPTGAHHWVELPNTSKGGRAIFLCQWCYDAKELPVTYEAGLRFNGRHVIPISLRGNSLIKEVMPCESS